MYVYLLVFWKKKKKKKHVSRKLFDEILTYPPQLLVIRGIATASKLKIRFAVEDNTGIIALLGLWADCIGAVYAKGDFEVVARVNGVG